MPETAKYWSKSARQCCRSADSFSSTQSSLLSAVVAVDNTLSTAAAAETDQDCFHSGRPQLFVGGVYAPLGVAQSWQLLLAVGDCRHLCWLGQRVFPWRVALAEQIGRSLRGRTGIWPSRERLIGESRPGAQLGLLEERRCVESSTLAEDSSLSGKIYATSPGELTVFAELVHSAGT